MDWRALASCGLLLILCTSLTKANECAEGDRYVTSITPREIGCAGGIRITIAGCGFVNDEFTLNNDPDVGNHVDLTGGPQVGGTLTCSPHTDKNHQKQVTCYTPPLYEGATYSIVLRLNTTEVPADKMCAANPDLCNIKCSSKYTPTIETMEAQAGHIGEMLTWRGRIFTTAYGTNNGSTGNPGDTPRILRVHCPNTCELKDMSINTADVFYNLALDEDGKYGVMGAKPKGTFIGDANATFLIENQYGRSQAATGLLRVDKSNKIFMYQFFSAIKALSPRQGAVGCTFSAAIDSIAQGRGYSDVAVYVGGKLAPNIIVRENIDVSADVPDIDLTLGSYPGDRGAMAEFWASLSVSTPEEVRDSTVTPSGTAHVDETRYCDEASSSWLRMTFIFLAPMKGPYSIGVLADNAATVFVNGSKVAETSGGASWGDSASIDLGVDDWNLVAVVGAGGGCMTVRARQFDSSYMTSMMTGNAIPETVGIHLTSVTEHEITTLTFNDGFTGSAATPETQTLCVQSGDPDTLQLALFGVRTSIVSIGSPADVQAALNNMPFVNGDNIFTVIAGATSNCISIDIANWGDMPALECDSSAHECVVTEVTKGVPDSGMVALRYNNVPSPLFPFSDNTTQFLRDLENAYESMFSSRCPIWFVDPAARYLDDCEDAGHSKAVSEVPAFSGRYSMLNPWKIYPFKPVTIKRLTAINQWMCFAVLGIDNNAILIQYDRQAQYSTELKRSWKWLTFDTVSASGVLSSMPSRFTADWRYACLDILTQLRSSGSLDTFYLNEAYVSRTDKKEDFYVDAVIQGSSDLPVVKKFNSLLTTGGNFDGLRQGPAMPNANAAFTMDQIIVSHVTGNTYSVELYPHDCGHDFSLPKLANSQESSVTTDSLTSTQSGGTGSVDIVRTQSASPGISGPYSLAFDGVTAALQGNYTDEDYEAVLGTIWADVMGRVSISRSDNSNCANIYLTLAMIDKGGDQDTITLVDDSLAYGSVEVLPLTDGCLQYSPIYPPYTVTAHTTPQVVVWVNSVLSPCHLADHDCGFTIDPTMAPVITDFNPKSGVPGATVTVDGSQFSAVLADNQVFLGDTECTVTSATTSQLVFEAPTLPALDYPVKVKVVDRGVTTAAATFSYDVGLTSVSPTQCGHGGQITLKIDGDGFSSSTTVTVGDALCPVQDFTSSQINCTVPVYSGAVQGQDHQVDIAVYLTPEDTTPSATTTFTYLAILTPIVNSITSDSQIMVGGGQTVTVDGSGLGSVGYIQLQHPGKAHEGTRVTITSHTDTQIMAQTVAGMPAGDNLEWLIMVGDTENSLQAAIKYPDAAKRRKRSSSSNEGKSRSSSSNEGKSRSSSSSEGKSRQTGSDPGLPNQNVPLYFSWTTPASGSIFGGTIIDVYGTGFGSDKNAIKAKFGNHECKVLNLISSIHFQCQIQSTSKTHAIDNWGSSGFGPLYAFNVTNLDINVGDSVLWVWSTPSWVHNIHHGVHQIEALTYNTPMTGGFTSGAQTRDGQFLHKFTAPGQIFVMSGYTDPNNLRNYKMTINVNAFTAPISEPLTVEVNGKNAPYQALGITGPSSPGVATPACSTTGQLDAACTPTTPTTDGHFLFDPCLTPKVTALTFTAPDSNYPRAVTSDVELNFVGDMFDTSSCDPAGLIGSCSCDHVSHTDTEFKCTPASACFSDIGVFHEPTFELQPYGYGHIRIPQTTSRQVGFLASITNFDPTTGSEMGGTPVTFTGVGIDSSTKVYFNSLEATRQAASSMIWDTPRGPVGQVTPGGTSTRPVTMQVTTQGLPTVCRGVSCTYVYADTETPTVTAASLSGTTVTMDGYNLQADITVSVGTVPCTPLTWVSSQQVTCDLSLTAFPTTADIDVKSASKGNGYIVPGVGLTSQAMVSSLDPTQGSIYGGTELTFHGSGLIGSITIDDVSGQGAVCNVDYTKSTINSVVCVTEATNQYISTDFAVSSAPTQAQAYEFEPTISPTISTLSVTSGSQGDTLQIIGTNFDAVQGSTDVWFYDGSSPPTPSACVVDQSSVTQTSLECEVQNFANGHYDLFVHTDVGHSNQLAFDYTFGAQSISPVSGDELGGQLVTISGSGFTVTPPLTVTIGGKVCTQPSIVGTGQYICTTPPGTVGTVTVSMTDGLSTISVGDYEYLAGVAPTVTGVQPERAGTGGGTPLTITGTGFTSQPIVEIAGSQCTVTNYTATEIQCTTTAHTGSTRALVEVTVTPHTAITNTYFRYVDAWSSVWTWGGQSVPQAGEFIVIPSGQTVLFDTSTPVLAFLLIQGDDLSLLWRIKYTQIRQLLQELSNQGEMIFDEQDVTLRAESIMIDGGGLLQIGTQASPFDHEAKIELFGSHLDKELPIYGNKVLAVRWGTLNMYGRDIGSSWTRLAATAAIGDTSITVEDNVSGWRVGDEIAIACTGERASLQESEVIAIAGISADGQTIDLVSALQYKHLGQSEYYWGKEVAFKAEVINLRRNVRFVGNEDTTWQETYEACADGFDTGEFVTQTCFKGRFGEESGSDQYGAHILIHNPDTNSQKAEVHIEHAELDYVGQAFKLGRYPIHFHRNGDMSNSYVRNTVIHDTFNRAVNVHATNYVTIEGVVSFKTMGGVFFTEDGIEYGNVYDGNLCLCASASTSLLNDDITPACFWVTNANNTYTNNFAACGSHFGFWWKLDVNPIGPSFTPSYCPRRVPSQVFTGNSAHGMGWFGLWIFPEYYPHDSGSCSGTDPVPIVIDDFVAWNCEKGAEAVHVGGIQFENCRFVSNEKSNIEYKMIDNTPRCDYNQGPVIRDSVCVGYTDDANLRTAPASAVGVTVPFKDGLSLQDVYFHNHDLGILGTTMDGVCGDKCAVGNVHMIRTTATNTATLIKWRWDHEMYILDDGSTHPFGNIDPSNAGTPHKLYGTSYPIPTGCTDVTSSQWFDASSGMSVISCPISTGFHRFSFNNMDPISNEAKNAIFECSYGTTKAPFAKKRVTHPMGWSAILVDGESCKLTYEGQTAQISNTSFSGVLFDFEATSCLTLVIPSPEEPDVVSIDGGATKPAKTTGTVDCSTPGLQTGNWSYDEVNQNVAVIFMGDGQLPFTKNCDSQGDYKDIKFDFLMYKCLYVGCIIPMPPSASPPPDARASPYDLWSSNIWGLDSETGTAVITDVTAPSVSYTPTDGADVVVASHKSSGEEWWVVIDNTVGTFPSLNSLTIEGTVEVDYATTGYTFELAFTNLVISGGRFIVGWPNNPMVSDVIIRLTGDLTSPPYQYRAGKSGPLIGAKSIANFGQLDFYGQPVGRSWTKLASTAQAGATTLSVVDPVDLWPAGASIVLTSTSYNPAEAETLVIASALGTTLNLASPLSYDHTVDVSNGITFAPAVGLLSQSVKVVGEDNGEGHGGYVLVSTMEDGGQLFSGMARIKNAEFSHMGQFGSTQELNYRSALAFLNVGDIPADRPSEVTDSSFHDLFNSAISVVGTHLLPINRTVVYQPVGHGIITTSSYTVIQDTMITDLQWTGSWNGRAETYNFIYEAGIYAIGAPEVELYDNFVSGSQRAGISVSGEDCSDTTTRFANNEVMGCLMGMKVFPQEVIRLSPSQTCVRYSGFKIYRNYDYGFYYQSGGLNVEFKDNIMADNGVGVFMLIISPDPLEHICEDLWAKIQDCTFIGQTSRCMNTDVLTGTYIDKSSICRAAKPAGKQASVFLTTFSSGSNAAASKPCAGIMAYNPVCGHTEMEGNTFADIDATCSLAITPNPVNDDMNYPTYISQSTVINVDDTARVVITRPNKGKINPSDCVDMDCDGLKKAFVNDVDGTLAGSAPNPTSFVSTSEWQWNGDPVRGLGDYRIPNPLLTDADGSKRPVSDFASYYGNVRDQSKCTLKNESIYAIHVCQDLQYRMLAIESLDFDTELRRLSPVAILIDRYLDLINGPQDHGWCNGYTCQKRISLFHANVLPNKVVTIYFSSTNPDGLQLRMLDAKPDESILVVIYYGAPYRIDTNIESPTSPTTLQYVKPTNGEISGSVFSFLLGVTTKPSFSDPHGTNYIDRDAKLVYVLLKGQQRVVLQKMPQIMMKIGFKSLTEAEFFGTNMIQNLAIAMDIPLDKVRLVDVVSQSTTKRRRKRATDLEVTIEIGNPPPETYSDAEVERNVELARDMMLSCQEGGMGELLSVPDMSCDQIVFEETTYIPLVPSTLEFSENIVVQHEGVPFSGQPKLHALDDNGVFIDHLGIMEYPWEITAVLRNNTGGHPDAILSGTLTIPSENGWFNFTDLEISHAGSGYIIDFYISYPPAHENLTIAGDPVVVPGKPLTAGVYSMTSGLIPQASVFTLTLDLRDETTDEVLPDIYWRGHTFDVTCNLTVAMDDWVLSGTLSKTFDTTTGRANFDDLAFSGYGIIYLGCKVESTPAEYAFYSYHEAAIVSPDMLAVTVEATNIVALRFNVDFSTYLATPMAEYQLLQAVMYKLARAYTDIIFTTAALSEGSIIVTFTIEGVSVNVTTTTDLLCRDIASGSTVMVGGTTLTFDSYMRVDGADYYPTCSTSSDDDDSLHPGFIALIAVGVALLLGLLLLLLIWVFKIRPRQKTHDNGRTVFLSGPNSKAMEGFYKQNSPLELNRPASAAPISTLYDDDGLPMRKSVNTGMMRESTLGQDLNMDLERSITPTDRH